MSTIRPLAGDDIDTVASLFLAVLRRSAAPPSAALRAYLRDLFIDGPFADAAIPSLVYERDGAVAGFIGTIVMPMLDGERPIRAAIAAALMVRDFGEDPLAGARLLKAFLAGAQDVSLTETAGDAVLGMMRQLRGHVMLAHSLDWIRVLQPARYAVQLAARRVSAAALLGPLAGLADRLTAKRDGAQRWTRLAPDFEAPGGVSAEAIDAETFGTLARQFAEGYAVHPVWSDAAMAAMLRDMAQKSLFGPLHLGAVRSRTGRPLGAFAYHLTPGGTARVLQLLSRPGQAASAIDAVLANAAANGAVAVHGRTDPQLLDALLSRRCLMLHESASIVHSRDATLVAAFQSGAALFNGLVGERWSRLVGDAFG